MMCSASLVVVGCGSAGFGAALAAARAGLQVVVVERGEQLGGTAVLAGVSNWEPGVGGSPFAEEIFNRLRAIPRAAHVWSLGRHCTWTPGGFPGGEAVPDASRGYETTLCRHGTGGYQTPEVISELWHGVAFDPLIYSQVLEEMLEECGTVTLWKQSHPVRVRSVGGRLLSLDVETQDGVKTVAAPLWIDASGDAVLSGLAGCERLLGPDDDAGEGGDRLNAVTLVYRVAPGEEADDGKLAPERCDFATRWPMAQIVHLPDGTLAINMLPTMDGSEYLSHLRSHTLALAQSECERRVRLHWAYLQGQYEEFRRFRFLSTSPNLGVRESYRVRCEWMLTVEEVRKGLGQQAHADMIALADHPLDRHSVAGGSCPELLAPYGIPFRCLLPKGTENLMVAGRCAGFTHGAASSCRLSRTMMALGQAAGTAAALSLATDVPLRQIDPVSLRNRLTNQNVILCHPYP